MPCLLTGTDLASASEVAESVARFGERYLRRVFTPAELAECAGGTAGDAPTAAARLAARFAAKEAVVKALDHTGALDWRSIEVVAAESGKPRVALHAAVAEHAARRGVGQLELSLSHHGDLASAVVVGWCAPGAAPAERSARADRRPRSDDGAPVDRAAAGERTADRATTQEPTTEERTTEEPKGA